MVQSRITIFAENSPFNMKDHLKARGYRWSDGSDGRPKSWRIEIGCTFLRNPKVMRHEFEQQCLDRRPGGVNFRRPSSPKASR